MGLFDIQIQIYVGGDMKDNRIEFLTRKKREPQPQPEPMVYVMHRPPQPQIEYYDRQYDMPSPQ
jgi:hypothetical protein